MMKGIQNHMKDSLYFKAGNSDFVGLEQNGLFHLVGSLIAWCLGLLGIMMTLVAHVESFVKSSCETNVQRVAAVRDRRYHGLQTNHTDASQA